MRIYGVDTEDTDIDYMNCSDEQFMDIADTHGLIWEDISEFVKQLNEGEINPNYITFIIIDMKKIKIFRIRYYDDNTDYFFKGIEELRDFAKDRISDGWETEVTEKDLDDDEKLFNFLNDDYGEELTEVMSVTLKDFEDENI